MFVIDVRIVTCGRRKASSARKYAHELVTTSSTPAPLRWLPVTLWTSRQYVFRRFLNFFMTSCLVLSSVVLCRTAFCRLSVDGQRRIAQRIDVDDAAYRPHGQKLAGRAFNREWNDVGETASAAVAGNRFHSGMVRATNDPWSCAVTAPMAQNLK